METGKVAAGSGVSRLSFDDLLSCETHIHNRRSCTYRIDARLARFLEESVSPERVTLETGSGLSTLVILRKGVARHVAIAPHPDEFAVIREFSEEHGIPTGPLESIAMNSQDYLPGASLPPLDLVLIDGDHAFPSPFVDWYYTADRLVVGGFMVVDDIQLVTGRLLADFMDADPKWERVLYEVTRFAVYRKLKHPIHDARWWEQPYVVAGSPVKQIAVVRDEPAPCGRPRWQRVLVRVYGRLPGWTQAVYRRARALWRRVRR
jgi:predicted O-methyltransferase YrrM